MRYALVFSGQGTQHAAMLPWLADTPLLQAMAQTLDCTDWRAALADPAWARTNRHAQPLLTATGLAAWAQLKTQLEEEFNTQGTHLPPPSAVAGYSVGELAAYAAAGVYDDTTALQLAARRAQLMDDCARHQPGGLLAVSGLASNALATLVQAAGAHVAIVNAPDAWICGGPHAALATLQDRASAAGAHCTPLAVEVASHTPLLADAAQAFSVELQATPCQPPRLHLASNAGGRIASAQDARQALARQISHTVQWQDCMQELYERQVSCVLEIGPGQALARLWNQRYPDMPARSADEFRSTQAIARWLVRQLGD
ncbi:MAG: Polyketide biosynthesis malonyl CoA-acyl carrier protein transacylase PksC [Paracidovorax wautersii]|uniref:Polyketide biosynthesis malonyl CoA-acyl carrier protein transacylase PksC n=1 Tax=Paracidovorax wautersii TaxID=1177982 RepID=A0A7V8FMX0_9BURK|nr:MAG: Polyketide biosynthesis malonyl CoA-acyl carrier protein transacylase PksC [Paracidovorax wautersii]